MTRTISTWEMYQRSPIAWHRLHTVRGRWSSARRRATGWLNGKTGTLSPSEPSDAIAEQSSFVEAVVMWGLGRCRPAPPSGLLTRHGGERAMPVPRLEYSLKPIEPRRRSR